MSRASHPGSSYPSAPSAISQGGASPSFDDVFRAHAASVARWAARLGGPGMDVDDVVQEVFLAAHHKLDRVLEGGYAEWKVRAWLYRATTFAIRQRRRRDRWRAWLSGLPDDFARDAQATGLGPLESLEARENVEVVYRVLDSMSEKYRYILLLFEVEGMSGEEIALLTGARLETVWVQIHRAREQFAKKALKHVPRPQREGL